MTWYRTDVLNDWMARLVPNGQGKGWAKGRTAATDARVARSAAGHRGRMYVQHVPPALDRRHRSGSPRTLPLEWSDTMGYVVGLIATDGCLVNTGRHLSFDSGDEELVRTFLRCLGRSLTYRRLTTKSGGVYYKTQFGDAGLYRWLQGIGLTPRKSLVLGAIDVPDRSLLPTVRGLFEGDGHISNFVHRPTPSTCPDYEYERLCVYFNSASRPHLEWVRERLARRLGLSGYLEMLKPREGRHDFFRLKFGKHDSIKLLQGIYPRADVPKLDRKWKIWDDYAHRHQTH